MESYLTMNISYFLKDGSFKINGDIDEKAQSQLLENVLFRELDRETDNREANKREEYHIKIDWYPHEDKFKISDNTGNYGLRDGILIDIFKRL